jgi:hypothetical protein
MDVRPGLAGDRWLLDLAQYHPAQTAGHYESFYQRANHPSRPLAFWLRYTIFAPAGDPASAVGELWAVAFDGETGSHAVAKSEIPIGDCSFARDRFDVRVGEATLDRSGLHGRAGEIAWDLRYAGEQAPILLLPERLYAGGFPKAKSLVPLPGARYSGTYSVAGVPVEVDGWVGSQNHNWGSRHTDQYAFGQVAGFDGHPDSFLEAATVRARIVGPVSTPWLTTLALRHDGATHSLVGIGQAIRAKGRYEFFDWRFASSDPTVSVSGRIRAQRDAFVGLRYGNPPGGSKFCLNTKIAEAEVTVTDRASGRSQTLTAANRALFEILTDRTDHGVPIRA